MKPRIIKVKNPDSNYFRRNINRFMRLYGGKWIIIVGGRKFAIVTRSRLVGALAAARRKYPQKTPFAAPIPKPGEIECILKF